MKDLKIENIDTDTPYEHGFKNWHELRYFEIKGVGRIKQSDSIGGCGLVHLSDWTDISSGCSEIKVKNFIKAVVGRIHKEKNGVGAIMCTVGQSRYKHPINYALLKNGFNVVSEFKNYRHGNSGNYTQKVYLLEL